jgi:hypothetical protein
MKNIFVKTYEKLKKISPVNLDSCGTQDTLKLSITSEKNKFFDDVIICFDKNKNFGAMSLNYQGFKELEENLEWLKHFKFHFSEIFNPKSDVEYLINIKKAFRAVNLKLLRKNIKLYKFKLNSSVSGTKKLFEEILKETGLKEDFTKDVNFFYPISVNQLEWNNILINHVIYSKRSDVIILNFGKDLNIINFNYSKLYGDNLQVIHKSLLEKNYRDYIIFLLISSISTKEDINKSNPLYKYLGKILDNKNLDNFQKYFSIKCLLN